MQVASITSAQVNLYAAAAKSRRGETCESAAACDKPAQGERASPRQSKLEIAMFDAFKSLGWTREAPAAQDSEATPAAASSEASLDLDDAIAGFAHALASALREQRGGGRGEGHCDRRGHHGMGPRIEMLVVQIQAGPSAAAPAAEAGPPASPSAPAAPAPASQVVAPQAETPVPASPASAAVVPAAASDAAATVAPPADAGAVPGQTATLNVAPPPKPEEPTRLVDAFRRLLDSLRDNGVKVEADDPGKALVRFLDSLAKGLANDGYGPGASFRGTFIRIEA